MPRSVLHDNSLSPKGAGAAAAVLAVCGLWQAVAQDRRLVVNAADSFTLAAVGDIIMVRPHSMNPDPNFHAAVKLIRDADAAFGNFEGTALDIRHFHGYPQAESGGGWLVSTAAAVDDLKVMGFDLLSRANNHTTDWGIEGMRETSRILDTAGLIYAGVGESRAAARAPRYLDTAKGRIGLVSMASSFTPLSRATSPVGEAPARPGLSALRTTEYVLVPPNIFAALQQLKDMQPKEGTPEPTAKGDLEVLKVHYRESDRPGSAFVMNPVDEREILRSVRQGKLNSDFLIATIHAHEPGNWSDVPADFLPVLAHAAIDAGADAFIGHGPHQLRGIEIYKGKPIFYSLGNFFFELNLEEPVVRDQYEQLKLDPEVTTDAELNEISRKRIFDGNLWYQGAIAVSRFARGQIAEIRLYPVELGSALRPADRGVPRLARGETAQAILERMARLSHPFGTNLEIEGDTGIIRPGIAAADFRGR